MALTATKRLETVIGDKRLHIYRIAFDASYPTGGETYTPGLFGLNSIDAVLVPGPNAAEYVVWDRTNKTFLVYTADGTEAVNASDQSAVGAEVAVIGI